MNNELDTVKRIKAALEAKGVDLSGPCGAFQITKRVAWALRATGAGLLDKPSGNNCEGYATDIICFPDGSYADILIDGGATNGPAWRDTGELLNAGRYRPAIDPGDDVPVEPQPEPIADVQAVGEKLDAVLVLLGRIDGRLDIITTENTENTEKIQQQIDQVVKDAEKTVKQYAPLLGGGLGNFFK